jgi:hypothetical protein
MGSTNKQLLQAITGALDCGTHFHEILAVNSDSDFSLGNHPQVVCNQCVDRLRELVDNSKYPHYPWVDYPPELKFTGWRKGLFSLLVKLQRKIEVA